MGDVEWFEQGEEVGENMVLNRMLLLLCFNILCI